MALTERNIRNIFIYAAPKFLNYGINLLTLPILTRILTPKDFGIVILVAAFPAIAVSVFTFGVTASAQRYYFEYRHNKEELSSFMFSLQTFLFLSFIVSSCGIFFFKSHISQLVVGNEEYGFAVFITYIAAFLGQIVNFYLLLYQNMERATVHSTFTIMQAALTAGTSLLFVWYFKMSYMGMIYGAFTSAFVVCFLLFFYFNRDLKPVFSKKILRENILYGLQIVPKSFTGFINKFFDKYMLNNMLSLSAVGVYNIGQTIGNTMFFLMNTVWSSFQPVCYKDVFDNGKEASVSVGRLFTIFAYITLMPVLLLILFAQEIVHIIAPASYYGAIDIIIIMSGAVSTQVFGMYVGVQYAYSKKAYWIFPISIIGAVANIIANIMLIPHFGPIGAGLSTVITYLVINGILTIVGQKLYKISYEWKTVGSLFLIIAGAAVSVLYLRAANFNNASVYLVKVCFIVFFTLAGFKFNLITAHSIKKIWSAFFKKTNIKEA